MIFDKKRVQILIRTNDGSTFSYDKAPAGYVCDIDDDVTTVSAIWSDFTALRALIIASQAANGFVAFDEIATTGFLRKVDTSFATNAGMIGPYSYTAIPANSISYITLREVPFSSEVTR